MDEAEQTGSVEGEGVKELDGGSRCMLDRRAVNRHLSRREAVLSPVQI